MKKLLLIILSVFLFVSCDKDKSNNATNDTYYQYDSKLGEENVVLTEGGAEIDKADWNSSMMNAYNTHVNAADSAKTMDFEITDEKITYHFENMNPTYSVPYIMEGDTITRILVDEGDTLKTPFAVKNTDGTLTLQMSSLFYNGNFFDYDLTDWNLMNTEELMFSLLGINLNLKAGEEIYHFKTIYEYKLR